MTDPPPQASLTPSITTYDPTERGRHTRWFLLAYYGLAVAWGIRNVRGDEPSLLDQLTPIVFAIAAGWWVIVDARRRGSPIPLLAKPWFFLCAGFLVPGYVVWSRRWRGVGWVLLHIVLWLILSNLVMYLVWAVVYAGGESQPSRSGTL